MTAAAVAVAVAFIRVMLAFASYITTARIVYIIFIHRAVSMCT